MIVPKYWAEARARQERGKGRRQITVRRFGWSDTSLADAQAMAQKRAEEALIAAATGKRLPRSEPRRGYNGAAGVPIREEILAHHGDAVVTRNSYGAHCLNTPDVIFADIDFNSSPSSKKVVLHALVLVLVAALICAQHRSGLMIGISALAVLILSYPFAALTSKAAIAARGGTERWAISRLRSFGAGSPDWNLRIYRTPAGLRVLVMNRTSAPSNPEVARLFAALNVDPVYARMCVNQDCFRARISPKPWRMGIATHMKPRPGHWPVKPNRLPIRQAWIADYEKKAAAFASCKFVEQIGSSFVDSKAEKVRAIHDQACKALSSLEIA